METCKDCEGYELCKAKSLYESNGEVCYWYISRTIIHKSEKQFIQDIREVVFSNDYPEYKEEKLQEMFKAREGKANE